MVTRIVAGLLDSATTKSLLCRRCRSARCGSRREAALRDGRGEETAMGSTARVGLLATAVCMSVAACGGGGSGGTPTAGGGAAAPGQKGGTLFVINTGPHNGLD